MALPLKIQIGEKLHIFAKCSKRFTRESTLERNTRIPTCEKTINSEHCDKGFTTKETMTQHTKTDTGEKPYKCEHCSKSFTRKNALVTHVRIHTNEKPYECEHCHKAFAIKYELVNHISQHTGKKPFKCECCGIGFTGKTALVTHRRIHTGEKPFKCEHCGKCFRQKGALIIHTRTHTGEKPFKCKHCSKHFAQKCTLVKHTRIHAGEKCSKWEHCGNSFVGKGNLETHTNFQRQTNESPFICEHFNLDFIGKSPLVTNTRTHVDEILCKYDQCSKFFAAKYDVVHHTSQHAGEKPYRCEPCGEDFKTESGLIYHLREVHTSESPYKCELCGKDFVSKYGLANHTKTHACDACGKVFKFLHDLRVHLTTHLVGNKYYKSKNRGESLAPVSELMKNVGIYIDDKPKKCESWDKRFIHKGTLMRPVNVHAHEKQNKHLLNAETLRETKGQKHRFTNEETIVTLGSTLEPTIRPEALMFNQDGFDILNLKQQNGLVSDSPVEIKPERIKEETGSITDVKDIMIPVIPEIIKQENACQSDFSVEMKSNENVTDSDLQYETIKIKDVTLLNSPSEMTITETPQQESVSASNSTESQTSITPMTCATFRILNVPEGIIRPQAIKDEGDDWKK